MIYVFAFLFLLANEPLLALGALLCAVILEVA